MNVSRPGPWGNPFKVGRDGTRADCVRLYRYLLEGFVTVSCPSPIADQIRARNHVTTHLEELCGKDLACWCRLDGEACHADVLLELANS